MVRNEKCHGNQEKGHLPSGVKKIVSGETGSRESIMATEEEERKGNAEVFCIRETMIQKRCEETKRDRKLETGLMDMLRNENSKRTSISNL